VTISTITRLLILVGAAFAAWALWLIEVCWVKGWPGLAWLTGFNWSSLPVCALIAILADYFLNDQTRFFGKIRFFITAFLISTTAFSLARWSVFHLFSGNWTNGGQLGTFLVLLAAIFLVTVGLPLAANRWLRPIHRFTSLLLLRALLLVLPLSFATIHAFPALNGSTDQLHSIKMGYPVLWTVLLIPIALRLGRKLYSPEVP